MSKFKNAKYIDYFDKYLNMDGYLYIPEEDLTYIKETYDMSDVQLSLATVAMTYPPPFADLTIEDAADHLNKLKKFRWNEYITEGEWFSRKSNSSNWPLTFNESSYYFGRNNSGNAASNYFQQANRWEPSSTTGPGPLRTWGELKYMFTLMRAIYSMKFPRVTKEVLRTCLSITKYTCAQFKPNVAKSLYDYFKAKTILDFSAGWGDRLAGFYASDYGEHYVGIDPREQNHPIYQKQIDFYESQRTWFEVDKRADMFQSPAEDFDFTPYNNYFDLVFTSPPYFNVERYSDSDTQSWVRYKTADVWNEQFLHKTLGKIYHAVKVGGIIAINIADVYTFTGKKQNEGFSDKEYISIVNPMNEFLTGLGMEYMGAIGMALATRPNGGGNGSAKTDNYTEETLKFAKEVDGKQFCEPIWIFRK